MVSHHKKGEVRDYTSFDNFIKGKIKDGTLYLGMKDEKLYDALRKLGIRRVKEYDDSGRGYTINAYPKHAQIDRVKQIMNKGEAKQERIDSSFFYEIKPRGKGFVFVSKGDVSFRGKKYRKGQFLPSSYVRGEK